jgi:hypothetical protein
MDSEVIAKHMISSSNYFQLTKGRSTIFQWNLILYSSLLYLLDLTYITKVLKETR